jgi:hypothetical protein
MLEYFRLLPGGSGSTTPGGFNVTPAQIAVVIAVLFVVFLVFRRK